VYELVINVLTGKVIMVIMFKAVDSQQYICARLLTRIVVSPLQDVVVVVSALSSPLKAPCGI